MSCLNQTLHSIYTDVYLKKKTAMKCHRERNVIVAVNISRKKFPRHINDLHVEFLIHYSFFIPRQKIIKNSYCTVGKREKRVYVWRFWVSFIPTPYKFTQMCLKNYYPLSCVKRKTQTKHKQNNGIINHLNICIYIKIINFKKFRTSSS